jgi:dihydrofolate reductase
MRRLVVFEHVSLDGYFTDRRGDLSWAKQGPDDELDDLTADNARRGGVLVFGRITYEMMAGF